MSNSSFFSGTGITATQSTAIETSVDAAGTSATNAAASALLASQKAALSTDKSNTAAGFANASEVSKDASVAAKNSAATSATNAASSASTANTTKNDVTALKNATQVLHDATEVFKNTANTKANEASASAAVASTKEGLATTAAAATSGSASAAATSAAASNQAKIAALAAQADAEDAESVAIANAALALSRQQLASTAASQALVYRNEAAAASGANTAATASANAAAASAVTAIAAKDAALLITGNYLGAHSSAPTTATGGGSLVIGMLYFNTTTNVMMVYGSGGWGAAGSSVNGTSERKTYIATANQTTFAATYDSGFVDIWQNGSKLYVTDFSATNGSTIVLASGAAVGDTIEIVAFGTFSVANQTFTGTTTVADLVVTGSTNLGSTDLTTTGKMLYSNLYAAVSDLPSASTYHGMFAHVHATGLAYYAHAGAWVALSRASDVPTNAAIRSAVEAASDSNVFTDADHSKLNAIEASATADQTKSDIEGLGIDLPAANLTGTIAAARLSTATTQAESDDSTKIATTAYVVDKITTLIGGAPSTLNDLNELAAAINDDASYNSTLTTALATKMPKAGGAFTGAVTTNSTIDGRDVAADGVTADAALPRAGGAMTGNVTFGDNNKATFGAGSDLQIYHDGSNSYISDQGTNDLKILATDFQLKNAADNEFMITGVTDGAVTLYHNNAAKIATTATGVDVTGVLGVSVSSASISPDADADNLVIQQAGNAGITVGSATNGVGSIRFADSGSPRSGMIYYNHSGDQMRFYTAATERMRIDSSGDVGIGTTDPDGSRLYLQDNHTTNVTNAATLIGNTTFTINGNSSDGSDVMRMGPMSDAGAYFLDVSNGGGSAAYSLIINPFSGGKVLLGTTTEGHGQADNFTVSDAGNMGMTLRSTNSGECSIFFSDATSGVGEYAGYIQYIHSDNSMRFATNAAERMRISAAGRVTMAADGDPLTITCAGATGSTTKTAVGFKNGSNGYAGAIYVTGTTTNYGTSSDYRLKTDAQPMVGATARVQALNPVNFEWIANGTRVDGFLAHEAATVVPEAVAGTKDAMKDEEYEVSAAVEEVTDDDGNVTTEGSDAVMGTRNVPDMQSIDQSKMVPLLVAALQEALTEITALKARVTALEA